MRRGVSLSPSRQPGRTTYSRETPTLRTSSYSATGDTVRRTTSSYTTSRHGSGRRRSKTVEAVSTTYRRTVAGYTTPSLIPGSFNMGDLLPGVNTTPFSSLLPDLNFFSVRKPTLTELSLPGYSFPVYVDTVDYWTGIGNKFTRIMGNPRIAGIAIPRITHSFYNATGLPPYQVQTDRGWTSPLYTSGFSDTITRWTDTILRDFSRNYSIYRPWEDTLSDSINWANRLYDDLRLGLLL